MSTTCWCSSQFIGCLLAIGYHVKTQQKFTVDLYTSLILLDPDNLRLGLVDFHLRWLGLSWLKIVFQKAYLKTGMTYNKLKTLTSDIIWLVLLCFSGTSKSCSFIFQTQQNSLPLQSPSVLTGYKHQLVVLDQQPQIIVLAMLFLFTLTAQDQGRNKRWNSH